MNKPNNVFLAIVFFINAAIAYMTSDSYLIAIAIGAGTAIATYLLSEWLTKKYASRGEYTPRYNIVITPGASLIQRINILKQTGDRFAALDLSHSTFHLECECNGEQAFPLNATIEVVDVENGSIQLTIDEDTCNQLPIGYLTYQLIHTTFGKSEVLLSGRIVVTSTQSVHRARLIPDDFDQFRPDGVYPVFDRDAMIYYVDGKAYWVPANTNDHSPLYQQSMINSIKNQPTDAA